VVKTNSISLPNQTNTTKKSRKSFSGFFYDWELMIN